MHHRGAQRVGYLGPEATFCEQALLTQPDLAALEAVAYPTMHHVLAATATGEVDLGVVAIENALEGMVNATVDAMVFDFDVFIQREIVLPVHLDILGVPGTTLDAIATVSSMPVALGQVRDFLHAELPDAVERTVSSTAEAARSVADRADPTVAAVANSLAGERYGLVPLASRVEDHPDNATRFIVVGRDAIPPATGHDKSTIIVFQHDDRPGSLLMILQEFAARNINLTRLESRPTKSGLGNYCFLIDLVGHIADEVVADALRAVYAKQLQVKFLGSYAAAGADGDAMRTQVSQAYAQASAWMAELQGRIG